MFWLVVRNKTLFVAPEILKEKPSQPFALRKTRRPFTTFLFKVFVSSLNIFVVTSFFSPAEHFMHVTMKIRFGVTR